MVQTKQARSINLKNTMKNKAQKTAIQGDVKLRKLDSMPEGKQRRISKVRCVLAEGEHTGHNHIVEDDEAELIQIGERMLLKLEKQATLKHQEHAPITLSPGIWEVGRVQEFDYYSMMARPVQD